MDFSITLEKLREEVRRNALLVRSLIPLIPERDKIYAYKWLEKLSKLDGNIADLNNRIEYLWFFVINAVQGQGMMPPFQLAPPNGELPLLSCILPKEMYAELIDCSDMRTWWKEEPLMEGLDEAELEDDHQNWVINPCDFTVSQPTPSGNGTYLYGCVFAPRR